MYRILRMFQWKCCYKIFRTRTMFTFFFTQTHTLRQQTVLLMLISFKMKTRNVFFSVEKGNHLLRYIKSLFNKINNESGRSTLWWGMYEFSRIFCLTLYLMKVYSHFLIARIQNPPIHHHSYSCHGFLCNTIPVSISMLTDSIDEILKAIIEES